LDIEMFQILWDSEKINLPYFDSEISSKMSIMKNEEVVN